MEVVVEEKFIAFIMQFYASSLFTTVAGRAASGFYCVILCLLVIITEFPDQGNTNAISGQSNSTWARQ